MAGPEPAGCCVALLVPHPRRTAVLVADVATSQPDPTARVDPRLPTLQLSTTEPHLPEILASVDVVDTDATAVLRQVIVSTNGASDGEQDDDQDDDQDDGEEACLLVEFDSVDIEPPPGWVWLDLDAGVVARLHPEPFRRAVASWVDERAHGWSSLRPAWSRPGWLARASRWMVEQMRADGRPALERPRQHQLWGLSVVLRAPSEGGDVFLKCSPAIFRREALLTQALAQRMPELVPEVIAVEEAEGWLLMRDLGAAELGHQAESSWHQGLIAHAGIQRSWLGRGEELAGLGVPVRSLTDLAIQVEAMSEDDTLLTRMTPELRDRWLATAPALVESCRRLDQLGPGPTLLHGDLHPWNVVLGAGGVRVFDWTDAAVSHPFVDLATYVFRTQDVPRRRRLVDAYLDAWSTDLSPDVLREAADLAVVVGALYQVQTYRTLLPTVTRYGAEDDLAGSDLDWLRRSLTRHQQGLESAR